MLGKSQGLSGPESVEESQEMAYLEWPFRVISTDEASRTYFQCIVLIIMKVGIIGPIH